MLRKLHFYKKGSFKAMAIYSQNKTEREVSAYKGKPHASNVVLFWGRG
jgi:hypothetical protein